MMATWQRPAGSANAPLDLSLPCLLPLLSASVFILTEKTGTRDTYLVEGQFLSSGLVMPWQKAGGRFRASPGGSGMSLRQKPWTAC